MKPESRKHVLEVLSTLLWVDMILWAELLSIIVFAYVFVSESGSSPVHKGFIAFRFSSAGEPLANFCAFLTQPIGTSIVARLRMDSEVKGKTSNRLFICCKTELSSCLGPNACVRLLGSVTFTTSSLSNW